LQEPDVKTILKAPDVEPEQWQHLEQQHGHEVVGFLQAYMNRLPAHLHPYVHLGLTSSDLVEYDLHVAITDFTVQFGPLSGGIWQWLDTAAEDHSVVPRAGRTHGQTAELTTLGHQFEVFEESFMRIGVSLSKWGQGTPIKSPGPTGVSPFREAPWETVPSTQILPRDFVTGWANDMLRLSNWMESLAMFIRLGSRSEIGEFVEGGSQDRQGSSAMPGKRNPIDSEKVCGLARIVRGYHLALMEVPGSMWEDRDLSNSSTERVAVPGLAACVEHMLITLTRVVTNLQIDLDRIEENSKNGDCVRNAMQVGVQLDQKVGPIEASSIVKKENW
jgi:adenylosuccinate lyase